MPTILTHAVAAGAMIPVFRAQGIPRAIWLGGLVASVIPDADVLGFRFGIAYEDLLGHRGLTHSIAFALALAVVAVLATQRMVPPHHRVRVGLFLFLATLSHGLLDACTNGGLGVAFWAPFTGQRYFFPAHPIEVSPLSLRRLLDGRGLAVLLSEVRWVWLPALAAAGVATFWRRDSLMPGERG